MSTTTRQPHQQTTPNTSLTRLSSQRIGPYLLGKTLGIGSTGRVKLGTHIETNQHVAIKIIPKDSLIQQPASTTTDEKKTKDNGMNKKVEREITIMKLIQHPNVMQLYDVYETEKELFLVLEHIEGGELFDYLVKKGRLSEPEALTFFQQIIFGIEFCHKHLICHRDLKPENLLLDRELNVKIADFGMASIQGPGKQLETSCGSPHYASPEIIKGIKYDGPAADIWSCGVILYALLTGNLPFDDENIRKLLAKVKSGMYFIPEHLSPSAKDLIKRMLVIEPSKRITMKGVMNHNWFISQAPKNGEKVLPGALENKRLFEPIEDATLIDTEIINSLTLLGWGDEEELVSNLTSSEENTVKVFYNLLHQRKWSFFENYDLRKSHEWDIEGGPRRRVESQSSLLGASSKIDLFKSELSLMTSQIDLNVSKRRSVDELKEMRKSAEELNIGGGAKSRTASDGNGNKRNTGLLIKTPSVNASLVKVESPLSVTITPLLQDSSDKLTSIPSSSYPTPTLTTNSSPKANSVTDAPTTPQTPTAVKEKQKLKIAIPSEKPATPNYYNDNSGDFGSVGVFNLGSEVFETPRFHRKKQEIPPTPLITSAPKRSWFASLLNFKPEVYTFTAHGSMDNVMSYLQLKLLAFDVKFQPRKEGYKCKYEGPHPEGTLNAMSPITPLSSFMLPQFAHVQENNRSQPCSPTVGGTPGYFPSCPTGRSNGGDTVKNVKFKIDVVADGEETFKVQFVQQQGAFSSFQIVVNKFKAEWNL